MPYFTYFVSFECLILHVLRFPNALFYMFLAATRYRKIVILPMIQTFRYFWFLLLGLFGSVISMKPISSKGFMNFAIWVGW